MSRIDEVAGWGREWQKNGDWTPHTNTLDRSRRLARGYVALLRVMLDYRLDRETKNGLDIGAGAGHLAAALESEAKLRMTASEWNEDGIELIRRENPQLSVRTVDVMKFEDKEIWDFVLCRELYPFTRVNAYSDQFELISRIIDALKPGGVFMLVGSTVSYPHCADYALLVRNLRMDPRIEAVTSPILETVLIRIRQFSFLGRAGYRIANLLGELVFLVMRRRGWAAIRVMAFRRRRVGGNGR